MSNILRPQILEVFQTNAIQTKQGFMITTAKLTHSLNIGADVTCLCPRCDIWDKALHMIKLFLRNGKTKLITKCFCIALFGSMI